MCVCVCVCVTSHKVDVNSDRDVWLQLTAAYESRLHEWPVTDLSNTPTLPLCVLGTPLGIPHKNLKRRKKHLINCMTYFPVLLRANLLGDVDQVD